MKLDRLKIKISSICLFLFISSFLFITVSSCEIGLGKAVDVSDPTIDITYPPKNAVVRDTFTAAGGCDDDMEIVSVQVSLFDPLNNLTFGPFDASLGAEGKTWSVNLNKKNASKTKDVFSNYKQWEIPDGNYVINAVAYDQDDKESPVASSPISIDNTAPVLVVSKPLAIGVNETPTIYGCSLKLTGDIAEDHETSKLVLYYREYNDSTGDFKGSVRKIEITDSEELNAVSSSNPLIIARFGKTQEAASTELHRKYLEIYDVNSSDETQCFYGGFLLEDNAKLYVNPGDNGSGEGNQSTQYYLLGKDFQNVLAVNYSLTAYKLKEIFKGQSSGYSSGDLNKIAEYLSKTGNFASSDALEKESDASAAKSKSSKFSLNPDNSPTWVLDEHGYSNTSTVADLQGYTAGSSLILSLSAGRDASFPDPRTVTVVLYELGSYSDTANYYNFDISGKTPIYLLDATGKKAPKWDESADDSHKSYTFALDTETYGLKSNYVYRMMVTGTDRNGTSLEEENDNNYLFKLTTNNNIPKITFTAPIDDHTYGVADTVNAGKINTDGVTIEGYAKTDGVSLKIDSATNNYADDSIIISGLKIINVKDSSPVSASDLDAKVIDKRKATDEENKYLFTINIKPKTGNTFVPDSDDSVKSKYLFTVTVQAFDNVANSQPGEKSIKFYVDNKSPNVNITTVSPSVSEGTEEYVNGKINISGTASDSGNTGTGLADLRYEIKKGSESKKSGNLANANNSIPEVWSLPEINTTAFDGESDDENTVYEITANVTAVDKVDNEGTISRTIKVKQSTDRPTLKLSNAKETIKTDAVGETTDSSKLWKNQNMFATTGNNKILGLVKDDDGLASVKVTVKQGDVTKAEKTFTVDGSKEYNLAYTLQDTQSKPLSEGIYQVFIHAEDNKKETNFASLDDNFYIAIDDSAPVFSTPTITPALAGTDYYLGSKSGSPKTIKVSGSLKDGNGITSLTRNGIPVTLTGDTSLQKSFEDTITLENTSGIYKAVYTAKDIFDQESTYEVEYSVDVDSPKISLIKIGETEISAGADSLSGWISDNNVAVTVTASDVEYDNSVTPPKPVEAHSGIKSITYSIPGNVTDRPMSHSVSEDATDGSGKEKWNASVTFPDGETGKIIIKVQDTAGNDSSKEITVKVDKTKPSLSALWYKIADSANSVAGTLTAFSGTIPTSYVHSTDLVIFGNYTDISNSYSAIESCSGVQELEFKIVDGTGNVLKDNVLKQITYYNDAFTDSSSIDDIINPSEGTKVTTDAKLKKSFVAVIDHNQFVDGDLIISGKDAAGNTIAGNTTDGTGLRVMNLVKDDTPPAIDKGLIKLENSYKSSDTKYYLSRKVTGDKLTISGTTTDNYGVDKTTIEITGPDGTNHSQAFTYNAEKVSTGKWEFKNIDLTKWKKSTDAEQAGGAKDTVTIKFNAYDKAGNQIAAANQPVITLIFDDTAPAVLTGGTDGSDPADTSNPFRENAYTLRGADVYKYAGIRIGTGDGGNYSDSSYGREKSIQIKMTFVGEKSGTTDSIDYFGSGVKEIEYVMFSSQDIPSSLKSLNIQTGKYIPGSGKPDPATLIYTTKGKFDVSEGDYSHYNSSVKIPCTYGTATIGGFESTVGTDNAGNPVSPNLLFVRAKDNCGNVAGDWFVLKIQLDQNVPVVTKAADTPVTVLTNGKTDIRTLTGTITDNGAGLKGLKVYVDGEEAFTAGGRGIHNQTETITTAYGSFTYTFTDSNSFADAAASVDWSLTLQPQKLKADGTFDDYEDWFKNLVGKPSPQITIEAEDWAEDSSQSGNKGTALIASFDIDTSAPTTSITAPDATSDINGDQTIECSVDDDHTPKSAGIYYSTKTTAPESILADAQSINANPAENWKLLKKITTAGGTNTTEDTGIISYNSSARDIYRITLEKDFDSLITGNAGDVHILLYAEDEAGNTSDISTYKTFHVDKDSDRPFITVTNIDLIEGSKALSSENYLKHNTSNINFKVTDDDGAVQQVKYRITKITGTGAEATTTTVKDWTEITLATGDTSITFDNNGEQILEFYVKDKLGKEFWSTPADAADTNHKIYLKDTAVSAHTYGGTATGYTSPVIYVNIDTNPPVAKIKGIQRLDSAKAVTERNAAGTIDDTVWKNDGYSSMTIGGPEAKWLKVKVEASDDGSGVKTVDFKATLDGEDLTVKVVDPSNQPAADGYYYYYVPCTKSGQTTKDSKNLVISLEVEDNVDKSNSDTLTLKVDDNVPVISITAPSSTETLSGSVTAEGAITNRETVTLYYAISPLYSNPESDSYDSPADYKSSTVFSYERTDKDGIVETVNIPAEKHLENICNYKPMSSDPENNNPAMSFYLWLDGKTDGSATGIHADTLNDWIINMGITTAAELSSTTTPYEYIIQLYFYVKAVDAAGNVSEKVQPILLDPLGNRPKVVVGYPSANGAKLGGIPTVMGTASGTNGVDAVWIKVDTDADDDWDLTDFTTLYNLKDSDNNALYTLGSMKTKEVVTASNVSSVTAANVAEYAIKVSLTGSSWNQEINKGKELYQHKDPATGTQKATIWVCATDTKGFPSRIEERSLEMDEDSPLIDQNIWLVQWASGKDGSNGFNVDDDGNITFAENSYTKLRRYDENSKMITGRWYIIGKVYDDTGISSISYKVKNANFIYNTVNAVTDAGSDYSDKDTNNPGTYIRHITGNNYIFCLPVGVTTEGAVGEFSVEFSAEENSDAHRAVNKTFKVTYDNKKPEIETKLVDVDTDNIGASNPLVMTNSEGTFTFSGITSEKDVGIVEQTGVERVVIYFTRNITDDSGIPTTVFDPMIRTKKNDSAVAGNALACSSLSYEDGIYWKSLTATVNGKVLTLPSNENVHNHGLARINDVIYRIDTLTTSAGTSTITLSGDPGISGSTQVLFAIANVVDNPTRESPGTYTITSDYGWGYKSDSDDDGDLMIEGLISENKIYTWEASINSRNISDGPVTFNYLVIDKAGNASEVQKVECFVKNNTPRIAGVQLGTDENGNGKVDNDELETTLYSDKFSKGYEGGDVDKKKTSLTVPFDFDLADSESKAVFAIKGNTKIVPEIVGGNGSVNYVYTVAEPKTDNTGWKDVYYTSSSNLLGTGTENDDDSFITTSGIMITVKDCLTKGTQTNKEGIKDGEKQKFIFTFSDSTPGLNGTTESQTAELEVIMDVALRDENAALNKIIPFYWKDKENNSLLWKLDEDNNPVYETGYELGHIELSKDLKDIKDTDGTTQKFKETGGTGIYTLNPKISGAVKLEGIAKDDSLLSSLSLAISTYNSGKEFAIASFDTSNTTWSGTAVISQATYGELIAAGYITAAEKPAGKKNTDKVPYISQTYGHVVHWTYEIDTEAMGLNPAAGVQISVSAKDRGKPALDATQALGYKYTFNPFLYNGSAGTTLASIEQTGGSDGSAAQTCKYKIDVVPYIRGIKTMLSTKSNKEDTSEIDRTALGHYPVATTETIYLYGFNLKKGAELSDKNGNKLYLGAANTTAYEGYTVYPTTSDAAGTTITNVSSFKSGKLSLKVGGIEALNNINNNDAKGDYTEAKPDVSAYGEEETYTVFNNFYNRKPNDTTNYTLTDDIVLDVWKINDRAAKPAASGSIVDPIMKINPDSGIVGFAYVSGTRRFSMANDNNSYQVWVGDFDNLSATGFAYDSAGNTYGTALGGDINSSWSNSKFAFMTSLWGPSCTQDYGTKLYNWNTKKDETPSKHQRVEQIGQIGTKTNTSDTTKYIDKSRVLSPSIAVTGSGTGATVYLVYYDHLNKEIRFRWAKNPKNDTAVNQNRGFDGTSYINDRYNKATLGENGTGATNIGQRDGKDLDGYTTTDFQIIAETGITGTTTLGDAGPYVSIDVLPANSTGNTNNYDVIVLAWYDETAKKLKYTYNTKDITGAGNFTIGSTGTKTLWNPATPIFSKAGMYCQIKVDAKGAVHFAGYDGDAGDVYYGKIASYTATGSITSCKVDTKGVIGSNLTLDVALDSAGANAVAVPYIGYYGSARPKMAYLSEEGKKALKDGDNIDGALSERFTGYWEVTELPTESKTVKDRVNVGVWKTKRVITNGVVSTNGGIITDSVSGGTTHADGTGATSDNGSTWGNGTKNPLVAYEIRPSTDEGYMETAQMQ